MDSTYKGWVFIVTPCYNINLRVIWSPYYLNFYTESMCMLFFAQYDISFVLGFEMGENSCW